MNPVEDIEAAGDIEAVNLFDDEELTSEGDEVLEESEASSRRG